MIYNSYESFKISLNDLINEYGELEFFYYLETFCNENNYALIKAED